MIQPESRLLLLVVSPLLSLLCSQVRPLPVFRHTSQQDSLHVNLPQVRRLNRALHPLSPLQFIQLVILRHFQVRNHRCSHKENHQAYQPINRIPSQRVGRQISLLRNPQRCQLLSLPPSRHLVLLQCHLLFLQLPLCCLRHPYQQVVRLHRLRLELESS